MRITPIRTLPVRLRLKAEGRFNTLARRAGPWLERRALRQGSDAPADCPAGYLAVEIHPYAQVGHQVSSWVAGYLWARDLDLEFSGGVLSTDPQGLFNFTEGTTSPPPGRAKRIRLVSVGEERDPRSLRVLTAQVARARRRFPHRVLVFRLALDPARWDQVPAADAVRRAMLLGCRGDELTRKESTSDYIAIHVRRGPDIQENHLSGEERIDRWVREEWHVQVVEALRAIPCTANLEIRVYALGEPEDFPLLAAAGVTLKLNGHRDSDLVELTAARLIVLSPSSFSFTAALASHSAVLGRVPWWHRVPDSGRWVNIRPDGSIDAERLEAAMTRGS